MTESTKKNLMFASGMLLFFGGVAVAISGMKKNTTSFPEEQRKQRAIGSVMFLGGIAMMPIGGLLMEAF